MIIGITGQMPLRPAQLKTLLPVLLSSLLFLPACDKPDPAEPFTPPGKEVSSLFDQFDSSYIGVGYWDLKKSRENPSFDTLIPLILPSVTSEQGLGILQNGVIFLDSAGISFRDDLDYCAMALFPDTDSTFEIAVVVEGNLREKNWQKALVPYQSETEKTDFTWFKTQSGSYWVAFPKPGRAIITANRSWIRYTEGNGARLSAELAANCSQIPQQSEAFLYIRHLKNGSTWNLGKTGEAKASINSDDLKQVYAALYFRENLRVEGRADLKSDSGVRTSSFLINTALNFVSLKGLLTNESVLTDYIDVESQDSSLVFKLNAPVSAFAEDRSPESDQ